MIDFIGNTLFTVILTIICYVFTFKLNKKYKKDWLNPLYTATILLILLLLVFHVDIGTYQQGSIIFTQLLKLAVVSLAVPLFKQWSFLKENYQKICSGVFGGTIIGIVSVVGLAQLFHLKEQLLASLILKSVTLPIALTISSDLGGLTSITVLFVIFSALISLTIGPSLFKHLGIRSKGSRGLAMGTSAQMLGANRSLIWGEEEGAMGSVAMIASGLIFSLLLPILPFLLKI
nr:LrgB family protein [Neobacillus sp. Marseille-Q6967]